MSIEVIMRSICGFISGFARLILFFASLLLMLLSIILLVTFVQSQNTYTTIKADQTIDGLYAIAVFSVYLIGLSVVGLYGSFFSSKSSIEWSSFLSSLNVLVGIGLMMYITPRLATYNSEASAELLKSQPKYSWSHNINPNDTLAADSTRIWDNLQVSSDCCGRNEPDDWKNFRPEGLASSIYPISCCKNSTNMDTNVCDTSKTEIWDSGCLRSIDGQSSLMILLLTLVLCANMSLGVVACLVIFFKPNDCYSM